MKTLVMASVALCAAGAQAQNLLWDYGVGNGTPIPCWSNTNGGQEFHEDTIFAQTVQINEYHYYSCFSGLKANSFQIEAKFDNGGVPGVLAKHAFQDVPDSETDLGGGLYEYIFTFPNMQQDANELLYWGCSGIGFEAAMMSIQTPGDGLTHQFNGEVYGFETAIGDQMFQLWGAVPTPGSAAVLGMGALMGARRRR